MTRILCLTSWYPPHHFGGYELSCHDVMVRLAERGHHVEVLTSDHRHPDVDGTGDPQVAAVHRRLQLYFRDGQLWAPNARRRRQVERHNQAVLREVLASARPDVVAVWHVGAMSLGLLTAIERVGIPQVFAVSDEWPAYARTLDAWTRAMTRLGPLRPLAARATGVPTMPPDLDRAGAFCFISEVTRDRCRAASPWDFPQSTIVYSGIDTKLFPVGPSGQTPARSGGADRASTELLYVGRIDERKGIRTLVRALAHLPDARLTIDGHAGEEELRDLGNWCRDAGVEDRVHVQRSERAALPEVYRSADVCVFASEWEEPFGLVPLESMACGTPVVATGVGGSGEFLIDRQNCVRFTAGDPVSLADAVGRVRDDHALRRRLIENGYRSAHHFDVDHLAEVFERWYDAAADGRTTTDPPAPRPALVLP